MAIVEPVQVSLVQRAPLHLRQLTGARCIACVVQSKRYASDESIDDRRRHGRVHLAKGLLVRDTMSDQPGEDGERLRDVVDVDTAFSVSRGYGLYCISFLCPKKWSFQLTKPFSARSKRPTSSVMSSIRLLAMRESALSEMSMEVDDIVMRTEGEVISTSKREASRLVLICRRQLVSIELVSIDTRSISSRCPKSSPSRVAGTCSEPCPPFSSAPSMLKTIRGQLAHQAIGLHPAHLIQRPIPNFQRTQYDPLARLLVRPQDQLEPTPALDEIGEVQQAHSFYRLTWYELWTPANQAELGPYELTSSPFSPRAPYIASQICSTCPHILARWSQSSACMLRRISSMLQEVSSVSKYRTRVSSP